MSYIERISHQIRTFKEYLDTIPEGPWNEKKTSAFIEKKLGKNHLWKEGNSLIYSVGEGEPVFFLSPMDAVHTATGFYHVNGASTQMAALMGAYLYFALFPPATNKIFFIFQEASTEVNGGALNINEHCQEVRSINAGFSLLIDPYLPHGQLYNQCFASRDGFEISLLDKEASLEYRTEAIKNTLLKKSLSLTEQFEKYSTQKRRVNVGTLLSGYNTFTTPSTVTIAGEVRALSEAERRKSVAYIQRLVNSFQEEANCFVDASISPCSSVFHSDSHLVDSLKEFLPIEETTIKSFRSTDFGQYCGRKVALTFGAGNARRDYMDEITIPSDLVTQLFYSWITIGENLDILL